MFFDSLAACLIIDNRGQDEPAEQTFRKTIKWSVANVRNFLFVHQDLALSLIVMIFFWKRLYFLFYPLTANIITLPNHRIIQVYSSAWFVG